MNRKQFTVEDHLLGKDTLIRLLPQRFVELVEACGVFEYVIGEDGIAFKGSRRNFAVAKPKVHSLNRVLVLPRGYKTPGFARHKFIQSKFSATSFV